MSAHMKARLTKQTACKVVIEVPGKAKKFTFVPAKHLQKLEDFLEKYGESESIPWEELAKDRIAKYKKSGLALRGALTVKTFLKKNFLNAPVSVKKTFPKWKMGKESLAKKWQKN